MAQLREITLDQLDKFTLQFEEARALEIIDADRMVRAIGAYLEQREQIAEEMGGYVEAMKNIMDRIDENVEFLQKRLFDFLRVDGSKSKKLPNGTVKSRVTTSYDWPDEALLTEWGKQVGLPIKEKHDYSVDKNDVKAYLKEHPQVALPEGLQIWQKTSLNVELDGIKSKSSTVHTISLVEPPDKDPDEIPDLPW